MSYLYYCTTSYRTDSKTIQRIKLHIGINFSTYYSKSPSTPLNVSSSSVVSGITTPFSFRNIDQNYSPVKKCTQFQPSKIFAGNSMDIEGTNLISNFDNKSLETVNIKSTTKRKCSTSKTVK